MIGGNKPSTNTLRDRFNDEPVFFVDGRANLEPNKQVCRVTNGKDVMVNEVTRRALQVISEMIGVKSFVTLVPYIRTFSVLG